MKATIKTDGYLWIYAETELEAYALSRWNKDNPISLRPDETNVKIGIDMNIKEQDDA